MSAFGGKADMAYCSANLRLKFLRGSSPAPTRWSS